jgi:hypothetical protein
MFGRLFQQVTYSWLPTDRRRCDTISCWAAINRWTSEWRTAHSTLYQTRHPSAKEGGGRPEEAIER